MTGMRIAVRRNGMWQWENFLIEPAFHVVDIGGSLDAIDEIAVMFFSAGFGVGEKLQFKISEGIGRKAKGNTIFKLEKIYNSADAESERENYTFVISEELEKTSAMNVKGNGETVNEATLDYVVSGERYTVKSLEANFIYSYFYKKDKTEQKIIGNGKYEYENRGADGKENKNIPEMPDILQSMPGLSDEAKDSLEKTKEALDKISDIFGKQGYSIPELPELNPGDIPGYTGGGSLPGGERGIPRIVIRPELEVFEFLPSLPQDMESSEWVEYESVYKYPDPENKNKMKEEKSNYTDKPSGLWTLWFVNPDYHENFGTDYEPPIDFEDTKDLIKKLAETQNLFNKYNLHKLTKNPQTNFEVNFKHEIQPEPEYAVLTEKAVYSGKKFVAELRAKAVTKKGNIINITIEAEYNFE